MTRLWGPLIRWIATLIGIFVVAPGLALGALILDFRARADHFAVSESLPRIAVVFGGSHDRVNVAMNLLEAGLVDEVFISGANRPGGIRKMTFAQDFDIPPVARLRLEAGHIIFAPQARNTLENAVETSCWLGDHPRIASVTLITSRWHMPRASVALERALKRKIRIVRFPSEPQPYKYNGKNIWEEEFYKYTATWFGTLVPSGAWREAQGICTER